MTKIVDFEIKRWREERNHWTEDYKNGSQEDNIEMLHIVFNGKALYCNALLGETCFNKKQGFLLNVATKTNYF